MQIVSAPRESVNHPNRSWSKWEAMRPNRIFRTAPFCIDAAMKRDAAMRITTHVNRFAKRMSPYPLWYVWNFALIARILWKLSKRILFYPFQLDLFWLCVFIWFILFSFIYLIHFFRCNKEAIRRSSSFWLSKIIPNASVFDEHKIMWTMMNRWRWRWQHQSQMIDADARIISQTCSTHSASVTVYRRIQTMYATS